MDKLKEKIKAIWDKVKSLKKPVKIVLIVAIAALIIGIVSLIISSSKNKYSVLFSNLEDKDAQTVVSKLKSDKVDYKVEGSKILVPTSSVSELRLQLAPQITGGSNGYELMDSQSSFGMTDEEFKIKKQRMLEGELEKSIKSFSEVETARVHITEANDSVFVTDKTPGKAAVTIKLKDGKELTKNQVKSIMSLVSGATQNIPKANIEVVDDKMNLLSQGLYTENGDGTTTEAGDSESVDKQRVLETNYESKLEKSINELLEPVLGKDKVKAKVNVDLDFDSTQKTVVTPDPNKVIKSQKTIRDQSNGGTNTTTQSPVDNNMSNTVNDTNTNNGNSQRDEQNTEYEVGKTEVKTISAPGEVKRMTASVVVDGTLDQTTTQAIQDLVSSAIGYKQERGDQISVAGMAFDQSAKEELKKQVEQMNADEENAKKTRLYTIIGIAGAAVLILIIGTVIFLIKRKKNDEDEEYEEDGESTIDTVIGDDLEKEKAKFKSIDFDNDTEESHVEEEIKKYAKDKPEQVVDVIKSWLNESER